MVKTLKTVTETGGIEIFKMVKILKEILLR